MAEKEIVLVNKSKGKFTVNFQGAFPVNKMAPKNGKIYVTEREYEWIQINYPHILEGEEKKLYLENEAPVENNKLDDETFFKQHHNTVKSAIAKMDAAELEQRYRYAQLKEVSEGIVKAIEDRILELDKEG